MNPFYRKASPRGIRCRWRGSISPEGWRNGRPRDLFILDDGFQHRGLFRNVDLVTVDPLSGPVTRNCFTRCWREPKARYSALMPHACRKTRGHHSFAADSQVFRQNFIGRHIKDATESTISYLFNSPLWRLPASQSQAAFLKPSSGYPAEAPHRISRSPCVHAAGRREYRRCRRK